MKNYRQLIRELPSKTVIMTVGSFNPPTSVTEMTLKLVHKLVESNSADHIIYVTEDKDSLPVDRKLHFLEMMFGSMNFKALNESNFASELTALKKRYKDVIVVASEDKAKLYESMNVVTTGNDVDFSKIKSMVTKGDFTSFKKQLPSMVRELDARRIMNEMRQVQGLELIKEDIKFSVDILREKYFKGEIYHVGDIVESAGHQYEIMDRGSNYLVVVDNTGTLHRKWVKDVSLVEAKSLSKACWKGYKAIGLKKKNGKTVPNCVPEQVEVNEGHEISYKGYTTTNMHHCPQGSKAFKLTMDKATDPVAMLNAIKTTDAYLKIYDFDPSKPELYGFKHVKDAQEAHKKSRESLEKLGCFDSHKEHWEKHKAELDKMTIKEGVSNTYNIAQDVLRYSDFMKLHKMNQGIIPDDKEIKQVLDPNISQQIDDLQKYPFHKHTEVGHTLETDRHLRRRKVMYATESVMTKNETAGVQIKPEHEAGYYVRCTASNDILSGPHKSRGEAGAAGKKYGKECYITKDGEYTQESADGEVEGQKVTKVVPLPANMAPPADDEPNKQKGKGFSAFFEKKIKKENLNTLLDYDSWMRQQTERK